MNKYINFGIIKTITIFYKDEKQIEEIMSFLNKKIDLNNYYINNIDNLLILTVNKSFINKNITSFFKELKEKQLYRFKSIDLNIEYLKNKKNPYDSLEECDDVYIDTFTFNNYNNLTNNIYNIEIEYYSIYFDGPYTGNIKHIVNLLEILFKFALDNPIKNNLCFGISIEK